MWDTIYGNVSQMRLEAEYSLHVKAAWGLCVPSWPEHNIIVMWKICQMFNFELNYKQ